MKKLLTLGVALAISAGASFAYDTYASALKNAIKQDIQNTKTEAKQYNASVKEAVKKDLEAQKQAQNAKAQAQKQAKIKEVQTKIDAAKAELKEVQNAKNITYTEKTLKTKALNKQIELLEKQKAAIK